MTTVSIKEAKNRLTALARRVEKGETVVVTRNGKPILDLVPHQEKRGLDFKALAAFKRKHDESITRKCCVQHIFGGYLGPKWQ